MNEARATYASGAQRAEAGEYRYDLFSTEGLRRLAAVYDYGAKKYSDNNWRAGIPYSVMVNHLLVHIYDWVARAGRGGYAEDGSEDDLAHAAWGLLALMEYEQTHPECNDLYGAEVS